MSFALQGNCIVCLLDHNKNNLDHITFNRETKLLTTLITLSSLFHEHILENVNVRLGTLQEEYTLLIGSGKVL